MVFLTPTSNRTNVKYLKYDEARTIYGCGVSNTRMVAEYFMNPKGASVWPRRKTGTQITIARETSG